jgi:cell wall-associated NlpC family hydrolase
VRKILLLGIAGLVYGIAGGKVGIPVAGTASAPASGAAATAIAYAQQQIGKPYLLGGTGPDSFDCSGLVYEAYGARIARTSQDQYTTEPHVTSPAPGDLVFFAGADGTTTSPGHVGMVTDPARHIMIDAYATGTTIRYETYGLPTSGPGLTDPEGFTDPAASGRSA